MFYSVDVAIPSLTSRALPVRVPVPVSPGTVTRLMVVFPPGCAGLVHVRISVGGHQVWPTNLDGDFSGDGVVIDTPEGYVIERSRELFLIDGWSFDDTFQHLVTVRFAVEKVPKGYRRVTAFVAT